MSAIWHNGKLIDDAPIFTATDRIRLGDGVFDTMLIAKGKPVHADLHFARLLRHAEALEMKILYGIETLTESAKNLSANHGSAALNTIVTRGPAARGLHIPENPDIQIVMRTAPIPSEFHPLHAIIAQNTRRNEFSPLSQIKSCNYGDNILALREAEDKGANEAILLNTHGYVACTTIGNIFIMREEKLYTPPLINGALDGITRALLMQKLPVTERSLTTEDLSKAEGIYITNSLRGVEPVLSLDGKSLFSPPLKIDKDFHLN